MIGGQVSLRNRRIALSQDRTLSGAALIRLAQSLPLHLAHRREHKLAETADAEAVWQEVAG